MPIMSMQEIVQSELGDHTADRAARERERRRWEVAKALFVRLMAEDTASSGDGVGDDGLLPVGTYHDIACQAVTAADEFLQRFYEP